MVTKGNTPKPKEARTFDIKGLAVEYGLDDVYIRRAIHKGALKSTLVQVNDSKVMKHRITETDFLTWRAGIKSIRARRDDGRSKFSLYATKDELVALEHLLKTNNLKVIVQRANPPKPKAEKVAPAA